ncbi:MAG TPA: peptidoglycan DD-metalloendopeptidase family protein [Blastocatellia bacterium]|nr:peptidoglycan DD-metalloendopeptidase family protein [Blastocatellia bacterium]
MTITRKQVLIALLTASFISTTNAAAQQANPQPNAQPPQSITQIVGSSTTKAAETTPAASPTQPQAKTAFELATVIPAAPNVIKRSATAIEIPADLRPAPQPEAKAEAKPIEPKYETRPVISTAQVGSSFGYRSDPFTGRARFHAGCDIKAHWGESIGASFAGVVQSVGWNHGYGNLVIINHGGGVTTHYAHLSSFDVQVGQRVERGQIVGRAGATGRATSAHLHYELRVDGNPVNPFQPLALDPSSEFFKQPASAPEKVEVPKPAVELMRVP